MGWTDSSDASSDINEHSVIHSSVYNSPKKRDARTYRCSYVGCNLVFSRPFRLEGHLRVHTGEKPFPCTVEGCDKAYTNNSHLTRHIKTNHKKQNSTTLLRCPMCKDGFSNKYSLKKHEMRKHNKEYPHFCEICQTGFKKKNLLAQHMFHHTGVKTFKCPLCENKFATIIECNKHKRNHKTYTCFCNQQFTRWTDILKHKRYNHAFQEYQCDDCKKTFTKKSVLRIHMKCHSIPEQRNVYQCTYNCPKFYSTKSNLMHHINSVHEGKTYDCTISGCGAKLSTQLKLEQHLSKHNNPTVRRKQPRNRRKRKDIGEKKRSTAVKLSGVTIPIPLEKYIIQGEDLPSDHCESFITLTPEQF